MIEVISSRISACMRVDSGAHQPTLCPIPSLHHSTLCRIPSAHLPIYYGFLTVQVLEGLYQFAQIRSPWLPMFLWTMVVHPGLWQCEGHKPVHFWQIGQTIWTSQISWFPLCLTIKDGMMFPLVTDSLFIYSMRLYIPNSPFSAASLDLSGSGPSPHGQSNKTLFFLASEDGSWVKNRIRTIQIHLDISGPILLFSLLDWSPISLAGHAMGDLLVILV